MKIVTVNGSLRSRSSNGALLRAVANVVPDGVEVLAYSQMAALPHFNPDLDGEDATPPPAVAETRALFIASDAVVISSPEYAHGIPGSLKNMLDWLVSTGELVGKPTALLNAAPVGGTYAQSALLETLRTMNWHIVEDACLIQPFVRGRIVEELSDPNAVEQLRMAMARLTDSVRKR